MTEYTDKVADIMKVVMFAYNYDRDMLHAAFDASDKAVGIKEGYMWGKFLHYCNEVDSTLAFFHTLTAMGSKKQVNEFIYYIFNHYGND